MQNSRPSEAVRPVGPDYFAEYTKIIKKNEKGEKWTNKKHRQEKTQENLVSSNMVMKSILRYIDVIIISLVLFVQLAVFFFFFCFFFFLFFFFCFVIFLLLFFCSSS